MANITNKIFTNFFNPQKCLLVLGIVVHISQMMKLTFRMVKIYQSHN